MTSDQCIYNNYKTGTTLSLLLSMFICKLHVAMNGTGNKCLYVSDSPILFIAHYPERLLLLLLFLLLLLLLLLCTTLSLLLSMFIFKLHVTIHGTGNISLYVSDSPILFVAHYPERVNYSDSIEAL